MAETSATELIVTPAYVQPQYENIQWARDRRNEHNENLENWRADRIPESLRSYPAIISLQSHRAEKLVESEDSHGINPWRVERCPNPFIFKHLWEEPPGACSSQGGTSAAGVETCEQHAPRVCERVSEDSMSTIFADIQPRTASTPNGSTLSLETIGSSLLDAAGQTGSLIADDLEMDVLTPATSMSSLSIIEKGRKALTYPVGDSDLFSFAAMLPEQLSSADSSARMTEVVSNEPHATGMSTQPLRVENTSSAASPLEGSTAVSADPPFVTDGNTATRARYPCPDCGLHFSTPGRRRYVCDSSY